MRTSADKGSLLSQVTGSRVPAMASRTEAITVGEGRRAVEPVRGLMEDRTDRRPARTIGQTRP